MVLKILFFGNDVLLERDEKIAIVSIGNILEQVLVPPRSERINLLVVHDLVLKKLFQVFIELFDGLKKEVFQLKEIFDELVHVFKLILQDGLVHCR